MNAIHGSLAKFAASRMMVRTPKIPNMGCLYNKNKYLMTSEGYFTQSILLSPGVKQPRDWIGRITMFLAITVPAVYVVASILRSFEVI